MATYSWPPPAFAFRVWEIETMDAWRPNNSDEFPRPPTTFVKRPGGIDIPWHTWTASNTNIELMQFLPVHSSVRGREATSILWCEESQAFWIAPGNFQDADFRDNGDDFHDWTRIQFNRLSPELPETRSVYCITTWGNQTKLNYPCPGLFEEYLHFTKFTDIPVNEPVQCHLVGKLSLILALHAMCPEHPRDILAQIRKCFWRGPEPVYVPAAFDGRWTPRNKRAHPGRALLVETGIVIPENATETDFNQKDALLRAWENGRQPMVSSW